MNTDMLHRLCIVDTKTGQVAGELPVTQTPQWSRVINGSGSLSATILLGDLDPDTARKMLEPGRWTVVYSYGGKVIQAGILVTFTPNETETTADLATMPIWDFFNTKTIVRTWNGAAYSDPSADAVFSYTGGDYTSPDPANQNLSLHSIARRLVEMWVTAGDYFVLPIVLPEIVTGTNERSYAASDFAPIGQRLQELTKVENGPEIEFTGQWTDETEQYFQWVMNIGNPRIGQLGFPHAWDFQRAWSTLGPVVDGISMSLFDIEKGQDTRQAADPTTGTKASGELFVGDSSALRVDKLNEGWPMMITVGTTHDSTQDNALLKSYAVQQVKTWQNSALTVTGQIRNDGLDISGRQTGSPALDQINCGDTAFISVQNSNWFPDDQYGIRILQLDSGSDDYTTKITAQWLGTGD